MRNECDLHDSGGMADYGFALTAVACEVLRYEKREQVTRFKLSHAVNAYDGRSPGYQMASLICESDGSAKKTRDYEARIKSGFVP